MDFIDSHAHLDRFPDIASTISQARAAGCIAIVTSGYSHEANQRGLEIAARFPNYVFPCIGIAPSVAMDLPPSDFESQFSFVKANAPKCVAIGEIGLDFHWPTKKEQVDREYVTFSAQLDFALEMKIPVVIHSRKAETEAVDFLISRGAGRVLLHFFSGGVESAKKAADAGYFFTTPPVRSRAREKVLAEVPLDLILLESDSPYVAKTPAEAVKAAELVSSAKGISTEDAIKSTAQNARRFYGLRL